MVRYLSYIILLPFLIITSFKASSQGFSEISISSGIDHQHINTERMGGGAAFFDYDNDGYLDIYLTGGDIRDMLYHNNGSGTFTEVGVAAGLSLPTA